MTHSLAAFPPFLIFFVGALLIPFLHERFRPAWSLFVPLTGLINLMGIEHGVY